MKEKEFTLSTGKVNLYSLLMIIPITAIYLIPFILIWDYKLLNFGRKEFMNLFLYILIFGIIIHELLHGITWAFFTKKGFKSIKFGNKRNNSLLSLQRTIKSKTLSAWRSNAFIVMGIIPSLLELF